MYAITPADLGTVPTSLQRRRQGRSAAVEGVTRRLTPGQHLFFESDRANFVFKVTSGVLRLTRTQKDGRRQVIAFGFPGDVIGLPCEGRHTTECDAITTVEVVPRRCDISEPSGMDPNLRARLMDAALNEIRMLQDHFLILGRRLASEKVAAFIVLLLDRIGEPLADYRLIRLPMNRADIADYLGLTPETVSRSITQLRAQNVIALDDSNTMVVRDEYCLRCLAEGDAELCACA